MNDGGKVSRRGLGLAGLGLAVSAAVAPQAGARPRKGSAKLTLDDRAGITDLFTAYVWTYDCGDEEEFLSLFADDALVVGKGTTYRGKPAILEWFRYLIAMRDREGDDTWMHEAGQFRFMPTADGCLVYAYATHFNGNSGKGTRGVRSLGYFTCDCVPTAQGWKFRRFSISAWDRSRVPWKKPLPWA